MKNLDSSLLAVPFGLIATLLLAAMKVFTETDMSWWLVFAPLWIPALLLSLLLGVVVMVGLFGAFMVSRLPNAEDLTRAQSNLATAHARRLGKARR